jgi:hypothetical protein
VKKLILVLVSLFIVGCGGYSPSMKYAQQELNNNIYTEVQIKVKDPENSVIIKDSIKELVIKKFNAKLVDKEHSDTRLYIDFSEPSFSDLQYDDDGYVTMKRAKVTIHTSYESDRDNCPKSTTSNKYNLKIKDSYKSLDSGKCTKKGMISTSGTYDFSITSNTNTVTDQQRFTAIKSASSKALDELISRLSILGAVGSE